MIFMVYYLESVYGKPWVQDGQIQYSAEEVKGAMEFIKKLEDSHVIPTLAVLNGDMADSIDKNAKWIDGKYAGILEWDSSASKFEQAVEESTNKPGQDLPRFLWGFLWQQAALIQRKLLCLSISY